MKMADSEDEEIEVLRKELCWLLEDQVHPVLEEIRNTLLECCRRFPHRSTQDEHDPAVETTDDTPSYRCLGRVGIDDCNLSYFPPLKREKNTVPSVHLKMNRLDRCLVYPGFCVDRLNCKNFKQHECGFYLLLVTNAFQILADLVGSREFSGDDSLVRPQRILLSSPNGTGNVYCVVTLLGDSICDAVSNTIVCSPVTPSFTRKHFSSDHINKALIQLVMVFHSFQDINFKHKQGKDHHTFKTGINPEVNWKLQQIQDAGNFLYGALSVFANIDKDKKFTSAKQVLMLLDTLMNYLNQGRSCLAFPKRKSVDELVNNRNMTTFKPPVPSDVALSFYIHSSKLILALYNLQVTNQQKIEITSRSQVECTVQWLNEAVMLFTLALQQCSQLKDKITVLQQYEIT
ncbi:hypothetical protein KUTeg_009406 [Tegillarca granosa]|uniref:Uncharacterized protein n=1 Tax=Tegillarca granosa TaxID=220873 RepID=A0ABQ9F3S8_TEGGR|nr:hypothetical protein KUTeg_009406 [Tegillarca granosa]